MTTIFAGILALWIRKCGGFKRTVCVYSHPLEYIEEYKTNTIKCDICLEPHLKSGWHCDCDFDICEKCYDGYWENANNLTLCKY